MYKTPFSDKVGVDSVPTKGSGPGCYDHDDKMPGYPSRDTSPNGVAELYYDENDKLGGSPSVDGPYKTPFSDKVGK